MRHHATIASAYVDGRKCELFLNERIAEHWIHVPESLVVTQLEFGWQIVSP